MACSSEPAARALVSVSSEDHTSNIGLAWTPLHQVGAPSAASSGSGDASRRRTHDHLRMARYIMREKLLDIGDDYWIENDRGERAYKVDGKAFRLRDTFVLENSAGDEVARIQERKLSIRDKMAIERGGDTIATVRKALVGFRDRFAIDVEDGADMKAHGSIFDHEYEIERDGEKVAEISRKWFRVRDSYGVEIAPDEDVPLILAITVAIDALTTRGE